MTATPYPACVDSGECICGYDCLRREGVRTYIRAARQAIERARADSQNVGDAPRG
jgi:hypothetical protein